MPKKSKSSPQEFSFEQAIAELEALVNAMEQGEIPLEDSLKKFERGIELTRQCQAALQQAEQKVRILIERAQSDTLADFTDAGQTE